MSGLTQVRVNDVIAHVQLVLLLECIFCLRSVCLDLKIISFTTLHCIRYVILGPFSCHVKVGCQYITYKLNLVYFGIYVFSLNQNSEVKIVVVVYFHLLRNKVLFLCVLSNVRTLLALSDVR